MEVKLSKSQRDLLKTIVKSKRIRLCEIDQTKELTSVNIPEEAHYLMKKGLITINTSTITYEPTTEGKHFFENHISEWLSQNILAILALIISIIALFN